MDYIDDLGLGKQAKFRSEQNIGTQMWEKTTQINKYNSKFSNIIHMSKKIFFLRIQIQINAIKFHRSRKIKFN
jgi:hypothetical protein